MFTKSKIHIVLYSAIIALISSGCADKVEVQQRVMASGIGIDLADSKTIVYAQIVNTSAMKREGEGQEKATYVSEVDSQSLFYTAREFNYKNTKQLYWAQLQAAVIGEAMAEDGIGWIANAFERHNRVRRDVPLFVAMETDVRDILEAEDPINKIPMEGLKNMSLTSKYGSKSLYVDANRFIRDLDAPGVSPVLPCVTTQRVNNKIQLKLDGLAVFRDDKLAGYLDGDETRGYLWLTGNIGSGSWLVNDDNGIVTIGVKSPKTRLKLYISGGRPVLNVTVKTDIFVGETRGNYNFKDKSELNRIEKLFEDKVKDEVTSCLATLQDRYKTDAIGCGNLFYHRYPELWKKISISWDDEYFPAMGYEINVDANLINTQMIY